MVGASKPAAARKTGPASLFRRASLPWLRLVSGLWLILFAATHLANHALGLISLAVAEQGRLLFLGFWRQRPVEASLALALLVHAALGLHGLWQRRTLRLSPIGACQLVL